MANIESIIYRLENDSTWMLILGISIVVFLIIVLVIVISTLRVRRYRNRFKGLLFKNEKYLQKVSALENELATFKTTNNENTNLKVSLIEREKTLDASQASYEVLHKNFDENEKRLKKLSQALQSKENEYKILLKEYEESKERVSALSEENTKYRTTNGRLLLKLENSEFMTKR